MDIPLSTKMKEVKEPRKKKIIKKVKVIPTLTVKRGKFEVSFK